MITVAMQQNGQQEQDKVHLVTQDFYPVYYNSMSVKRYI